MSAPVLSRREMFARLFRTERKKAAESTPPSWTAPLDRVAIVQGRYCLAYQKSFCSTCAERCPVPGALLIEEGLPRIVADACTGCGVCRDVCPAPKNAILLAPRRSAARVAAAVEVAQGSG